VTQRARPTLEGVAPLPAQETIIAPDPSPCRAGDQRIKRITRHTHQGEQQTEERDLERHRAARGIDELRQEGQEEQRRFRIQQIDDETVAVEPRQTTRRQRHLRGGCICPAENPPRAHIDEIARAHEFDDGEGKR
jgi:hypothetical protein